MDLTDVTLILNDWGGGQFLLLEPEGQRISRLVLVACEAFDNFPPGPARPLAALAKVPGEDQPELLAQHLRAFLNRTQPTAGRGDER